MRTWALRESHQANQSMASEPIAHCPDFRVLRLEPRNVDAAIFARDLRQAAGSL